MWRDLIRGLTQEAAFTEPATATEIADAQEELGNEFPESLRDALRDSNGVVGEFGLDLLWPVSRIVSDNLRFRATPDFRKLYMPFDCLLFFADGGNGDQFAFAVLEGRVRRDDVFVWDHEQDSRLWVAPSLDKYFEWWLTGRIEI